MVSLGKVDAALSYGLYDNYKSYGIYVNAIVTANAGHLAYWQQKISK
ncbi:MAG: hypothetical protein LBG97_08795 [Coriobacteriales bacterium]|jgi:hypothetical protein|nr:hypothetical protein [Coriobacteriales bacterium]